MLRGEIWTPANAITAYRLVVGPVCMGLLARDDAASAWIVLALMISAELSDLLDGYVARASRRVSNLGKILDPLADCVYRGSVFIAFAINGWMPVWMLSIIMWRDLAVSYLREIAQLRAQTLSARASGKWKAIVQGLAQVTVAALIAFLGKDALHDFALPVQILLWAATAVTAYSLVDYAAGVLQPPEHAA